MLNHDAALGDGLAAEGTTEALQAAVIGLESAINATDSFVEDADGADTVNPVLLRLLHQQTAIRRELARRESPARHWCST